MVFGIYLIDIMPPTTNNVRHPCTAGNFDQLTLVERNSRKDGPSRK